MARDGGGIAAGAVAELVKLGAKPQNIRAAIGPASENAVIRCVRISLTR